MGGDEPTAGTGGSSGGTTGGTGGKSSAGTGGSAGGAQAGAGGTTTAGTGGTGGGAGEPAAGSGGSTGGTAGEATGGAGTGGSEPQAGAPPMGGAAGASMAGQAGANSGAGGSGGAGASGMAGMAGTAGGGWPEIGDAWTCPEEHYAVPLLAGTGAVIVHFDGIDGATTDDACSPFVADDGDRVVCIKPNPDFQAGNYRAAYVYLYPDDEFCSPSEMASDTCAPCGFTDEVLCDDGRLERNCWRGDDATAVYVNVGPGALRTQ